MYACESEISNVINFATFHQQNDLA